MSFRIKLLAFSFMLVSATLSGQTMQESLVSHTYPQKHRPQSVGVYSSGGYYHSGKTIYNVMAGTVCKVSGDILSFDISPDGKTLIVLYSKGKGRGLAAFDLWKSGNQLFRYPADGNPSSSCFSPEGTSLYVSDADGKVYIYDVTRKFAAKGVLEIGRSGNIIAVSRNERKMVVANKGDMILRDLNYGTHIMMPDMDSGVQSVHFTHDGTCVLVLLADGRLQRYDAQTGILVNEVYSMGKSIGSDLHPEDKYIAVVSDEKRIAVVNILNEIDRQYYEASDEGVTSVKFAEDAEGNDYIFYNTANSVEYQSLSDLLPNYGKLLADELDLRMTEWSRKMDTETFEEYNLRVNPQTIEIQKRLYEEEIATRMAGDALKMAEITLGSFNPKTNTLAVNVSSMPPFYLDVPAEDVGFFMDTDNLEFSNPVYRVGKDDRFELLHLEVFNRQTGQTYTFDNMERQELSYMYPEEDFVPVDLVMMSNMDQIKLQGIKDNIVTNAKKMNTISNHTDISVAATVSSHLDDAGNKILDYNIGFEYKVDEGYSRREDYSAGEYRLDRSGAARSMCSIIETAFDTDFAKYIKSGKKLQVIITGTADVLPIKGRIRYDGSYGNFIDYPVGDDTITVTAGTGITDNRQLALLRAAGLASHISENLEAVRQMEVEYVYNVVLMDKAGGKYRKVSVDFKFIDVF
ncbi:MAG: WD40 repeat domain-containing protein [Bacteroidales bacterium]|nr:WD40 repeat domain-containing protein [Bacteroidales bacterium]